MLREQVGKERRPLSWIAGPQGIVHPERPCMRDLKRERAEEGHGPEIAG